MSASQVDPHDKMRARDVNKVARGEQAPRPPHEYGKINQAPPKQPSSHPYRQPDHDDRTNKLEEARTAPNDAPFPVTNQTRHCYALYLEYHKCIEEKGKEAPECEKFAKYYRSLCPVEWTERWNEQRERGVFPGPI